jgi:predicted transcriptional regulator
MNLDDEQLAELERLAAERGTTVAQLFAEAIDQYLVRESGGLN